MVRFISKNNSFNIGDIFSNVHYRNKLLKTLEKRAIVYVVSKKPFSNNSNKKDILYIGSTGGIKSRSPKVRIGGLLVCMLGFFDHKKNKRHVGGERIFKSCRRRGIVIEELFINIIPHFQNRKLESQLIKHFKPTHNRNGKGLNEKPSRK